MGQWLGLTWLLVAFLGGIWFLFGMPVTVAALAWDYRRKRKVTISLLVSVVMLVVFYISGTAWWILFIVTQHWKLSFMTTIAAAGDSDTYGHVVEHTAESVLGWLLVVPTVTALIAGVVTAVVKRSLVRRRHQLA